MIILRNFVPNKSFKITIAVPVKSCFPTSIMIIIACFAILVKIRLERCLLEEMFIEEMSISLEYVLNEKILH